MSGGHKTLLARVRITQKQTKKQNQYCLILGAFGSAGLAGQPITQKGMQFGSRLQLHICPNVLRLNTKTYWLASVLQGSSRPIVWVGIWNAMCSIVGYRKGVDVKNQLNIVYLPLVAYLQQLYRHLLQHEVLKCVVNNVAVIIYWEFLDK